MTMHPDLDVCAERAIRDMIVLLGDKAKLSCEDAYTLSSSELGRGGFTAAASRTGVQRKQPLSLSTTTPQDPISDRDSLARRANVQAQFLGGICTDKAIM